MFGVVKKNAQKLIACWVVAAIFALLPTFGFASVFGNNARSAIDLSARIQNIGSNSWTQAAIGLDVHQVFSSRQGDIGTLTFQPFVLRVDHSPNVQGIFDDEHDWALQWRIANFNYTGLGHGRFNVRVGHFELPFGLEQVVQTNGTLYQVETPTGLKADWGMSINGRTQLLNYELAYTTGSGNELDIGNTGLLVGRIGTPSDRAVWVGLSYLNGEIQGPNEPIDRKRWGIDVGMLLPMGFSVLGEVVRSNEPLETGDHLYVELRWQTPPESLHLFSQWRQARIQQDSELNEEQSIALGIRYEPGRYWSLSAQIKRQLLGPKAENQLTIQLRYRFRDVI